MQTVIADRHKDKRIPARRLPPHIGMGKGRDHAQNIERAKLRRRAQIEQGHHAQTDQEQLDRVADRPLHRIQLGDMVMRRMDRPEQRMVMHQPVHPVLPELDQKDHQRHLPDKRQMLRPQRGDPPMLLQRAQRIVGQLLGEPPDGEGIQQQIERVGGKFGAVHPPTGMALGDQLHAQDQRGDHHADHGHGPLPLDPSHRRQPPECDQPRHHGRLHIAAQRPLPARGKGACRHDNCSCCAKPRAAPLRTARR